MNLVQESFRRWLHLERDHERLANYRVYDAYYNGDHEVDIPPKVRAALGSELGTVSNYCKVVVDTAVDYICSGEIGIEAMGKIPHTPGRMGKIPHTSGEGNQDLASEAEALLYDVYEANDLLHEEMVKAITIMCKSGDVFLKLYIEDGEVKVRVLRPDICFPRYRSDDYKQLMFCAIKWFDEGDAGEEDPPENPPQPPFTKGGRGGIFTKGGGEEMFTRGGGEEMFTRGGREEMSARGGRRKGGRRGRGWKAQVFRPDVVEYYELGETEETEYSEWELVDIVPNQLGFIPIVHIKNTVDDLEYGVSDLQVMTDLQDALNKTLTDMLLTMDNQAFQRLFIFGSQTPKGHEISMEPGTITEVPNEEGKLEVVEAADIRPFMEAMKEIVDQICTVTSTPRFGFPKSGGGQVSGYALRVHHIPLERKCGKKKTILKSGFGRLNRMIFAAAKLLGMGDYTEFSTKIQFAGGLPIDEESRMRVHEMELKNKIKSRRTVMQERGIVDIDAEMAQIEAEG